MPQLLLTYTPVHQHTFPQTRPGHREYDARGDYVGTHPECRTCHGYGTDYGMRFSENPNTPFKIEFGFFECPTCDGRMWAPYAFKEVAS